MEINKNELTKEMLEKAMHCKNAEELMALAKTGGIEAEAYLAELEDVELDEEHVKKIAGGVLRSKCHENTKAVTLIGY